MQYSLTYYVILMQYFSTWFKYRRHGTVGCLNLSIINILPNCVANIYIKLKSITSKLHNMSASIAFIKKALFFDVMQNPT